MIRRVRIREWETLGGTGKEARKTTLEGKTDLTDKEGYRPES